MRRVTVTLVSVETTTDPDGNTTVTEVETPVDGCLFAARSSTERADPRSPAVITGATVYMPEGTVVTPDDLIRVDGIDHQVEGEPGVWAGRGVEVAVKRTA